MTITLDDLLDPETFDDFFGRRPFRFHIFTDITKTTETTQTTPILQTVTEDTSTSVTTLTSTAGPQQTTASLVSEK